MPEETKPSETSSAPDLAKLVEAVMTKAGNPDAALKSLVADNYALKDDLKSLRAKLPAEGSVVLTGDDAKDWAGYRSLGKPSDLRKTVDEHKTFAAEVSTFRRDTELRDIADKAKVKFPVLRQLAGDLAFEVKPVKGKDGKETDVVHVKAGEAAPVPLDDYAAKHWGDFLPALKPSGSQQQTQQTRQPGTPPRLDFHRPDPAQGGNTPPPPPQKLDPGARLLQAARGAF